MRTHQKRGLVNFTFHIDCDFIHYNPEFRFLLKKVGGHFYGNNLAHLGVFHKPDSDYDNHCPWTVIMT